MTLLEEHTLRFWTLMRHWKRSGFVVTANYAKENELPTLAARTPFKSISNRISKELQNDHSKITSS